MAAVRRDDVAMMRLLIAHGASVSEIIHSDAALVSHKSALLVAGASGNEEVITELVTSGVDVNQPLGRRGTVLHHYPQHDKLMNILVRLGADPNAEDERGNSVFSIVLDRGYVRTAASLDLVLESLCHLLPSTRRLYHRIPSGNIFWLHTDCTMLLLQHGATVNYSHVLLEYPSDDLEDSRLNRTQHSAEFIELLRAADTDFSGVRQRIASLDRTEWEVLNLDVLEDKLSQPLTLQTACVISV